MTTSISLSSRTCRKSFSAFAVPPAASSAFLQIGFVDVAHRSDFHTLLYEISHVVTALASAADQPQPDSVIGAQHFARAGAGHRQAEPAPLTAARLDKITSVDLLAHRLFLFFANEDLVQSVAYCSRIFQWRRSFGRRAESKPPRKVTSQAALPPDLRKGFAFPMRPP